MVREKSHKVKGEGKAVVVNMVLFFGDCPVGRPFSCDEQTTRLGGSEPCENSAVGRDILVGQPKWGPQGRDVHRRRQGPDGLSPPRQACTRAPHVGVFQREHAWDALAISEPPPSTYYVLPVALVEPVAMRVR